MFAPSMPLRKLLRKPALVLALACLVQWALLFAMTTPAWDAAFYYSYARSIVFDGDLRVDNDLRLSYPTTAADFAAKGLDQVRTETGRVVTPFAVGSGLVWLPWLTVLRLGAALGQAVDRFPASLTGYEWYFTAGLAAFSMALGWLAHWIGYRIGRVTFGRFSALAAALTVLFASPLLYYQYREPLYSHATSAFVTGLVVLVWWRTAKTLPGNRFGVLLGGVIGLAALVRWQHLVYLALPGVSAVWWWFSSSTEERGKRGWPVIRYLLVVGLAALVVLSFQLAHWRVVYGSWLTIPQGNSFIDWRAPFWQPLLFSTFRGILPWMPVLVLAVIGLLVSIRRNGALVVPLLLVLALEFYVNASTRDWFAGAGFGPRRFTSELVIIILGYAGLLQAMPDRFRPLIATAAGVMLGLHQWILLRYGLLEKIGGRTLSMSPNFEWAEGTYSEFFRALSSHFNDLVRAPFDFFVLPGSPIHLLSIGVFPIRQIIILALTLLFMLFLWQVGRWLGKQMRGSWLFVGVSAVLIVTADLWLLIWG
ncbi:MAG: hypothetical protein WAM60_19310 [Candidatus Promineifilaceae bacterium]